MKDQKQRFKGLVSKEFFGLVNSPIAYLILVPFLLISHYMFLRTALVLGDANLRPFVELIPWFAIVLAPALAMRVFGDEQKKGTTELLFAHPTTEWMLVGAKYVGLLLFYGLMLVSTLALPLILVVFAEPDLGLMLNQYLGTFLVGATFLAIGLAASAYIRSPIGSFLVGAAINFGLVLVGMNFVLSGIPAPFNRFLIELGVSSHLNTMTRGLLDLRDLIYFVTIIGVALTAAVLKLSERKAQDRPREKRKLQVVLGLIILVGLATNMLASEYPIRLDMTSNRRFSVSKGTKELLGNLPDRVTMTLYASTNLPGQMQLTLREASDRLKDFSRYGRDQLRVETVLIEPTDTEARAQAMEQGMQEITFNQIGAGSFQAQTGFLGLQIRYGNETEIVPFLEEAGNLEYQLSRMIYKLTREKETTLALVSSVAGGGSTQEFETTLGEQYKLERVTGVEQSIDWEAIAAGVIIDDGGSENATAAARISEGIEKGKNMLFLVDGVAVSQALLSTEVSQSKFLDVTKDLGMEVEPRLAYDLRLNENIQVPSGPVQYIVAYPFWIRAQIEGENLPGIRSGNNVLLGWPSPVRMEGEQIKPTLKTSVAAGTQGEPFIIQPQELAQLTPQGEELVLGAVKEGEEQRVVVIGDAQIVFDEFWRNAPENQTLVGNLIDWIAADEILSSIPQRTGERVVFEFVSLEQIQMIQYAATLIPPIVVSVIGIYWLKRRRQKMDRVYVKEQI